MAIYDDQMEIGFPGMKVDSGDDRVETFPAGGTVPFGAIVVTDPAGTAPINAVNNPPAFVPGAIANAVKRGVALHSHTIPQEGYVQYDCMSVMTRGLAWVRANAANAIAINSQLAYNAAGFAVHTGGTAFEGAVVRGPVVSLANGQFMVPVEFHSPLDADAIA